MAFCFTVDCDRFSEDQPVQPVRLKMRACGDELFKPLHQPSLHYCKDISKLLATRARLNHIASAMRLPLLCAAIRVFMAERV
jgi:hypothetical protein